MREIIHLSVGQCGNQVSSKFWEAVIGEHGLDNEGTLTPEATADERYGLEVYFAETAAKNKFVPRTVLVDLGASLRSSRTSYVSRICIIM